jgi:hypothetical protein
VDRSVRIIDYPLLLQTYPNLLLSVKDKVMAEADYMDDTNALNIDNFVTSDLYIEESERYKMVIKKFIKDAVEAKGLTFDNMLNVDFDLSKPTKNTVIESIPLVFDENVVIRNVKQRVQTKKIIDLKKRLYDVDSGFILNVSKINNHGAKTAIVKYNEKTDAFVTQDKQILSNNLEAFKTFVNLYPKGDEKFKKELIKAEEFFNK